MVRLNDDEIQILGTPCFSCAGTAKLLIKAGLYEDKAKKAEYEQAVFAHWGLGLYKKHGENWREEAGKVITECVAKIKEEENNKLRKRSDTKFL